MKKRSGLRLFFACFLISVLLSAAIVAVANDAFALTAEAESRTVVIPEGADAKEVASVLKKNGLIAFPTVFRLYARLRGFGDTYLAGEFTLDRNMSYDEYRYALMPRRGVREQLRVTIPEGYTTAQIVALFTDRGIGTPEGFRDAIENGGSYGFSFVEAIPKETGRLFRLDGYLFPDTYFVYADSTEKEIVAKLLGGFDKRFDASLREDAARLGYTVDEVVRLASLVEGEAYFRSEMPEIASVFYNRLQSGQYPFLESDAAVKYGKRALGDDSPLTAEDIRTVDSPYNTYRNRGLPPGAICSPSREALEAAVHPAETNYYFFLSGKDKHMVFSVTYAEHMRAVAALRREAERKQHD